MRRILLLISALLALAACHPTGRARCDQLLDAQEARIEGYGWHLRCDPTMERPYFGLADTATKTVWIWADKITDDRVLRKVAWHELGHIIHSTEGIPLGPDEWERWAEGFAYCAEPIAGIRYGYGIPPSCDPYEPYL